MENDIRKEVISALKQHKAGFTVTELAEKLKISRHTIANVFAFLEGAEKITIRKAGMAKIHYWKGRC